MGPAGLSLETHFLRPLSTSIKTPLTTKSKRKSFHSSTQLTVPHLNVHTTYLDAMEVVLTVCLIFTKMRELSIAMTISMSQDRQDKLVPPASLTLLKELKEW